MRGISFRGLDRQSLGLPPRGAGRTMKPLKERNPVSVALVGLALLAIIGLAVFFEGDLPIIGGGTGYTAYFAEAAGLQPGNEVRIAGVTVGKVTGVSLAGAKVAVTFKVKNAWIGNRTTVAIEIKTVLGDKYLALDPLGSAQQNPGTAIPLSRTTSPYDVTEAFGGVGQQISKINTAELTKSLATLSDAFSATPPYVRKALSGLANLSKSVASKDSEVTSLLAEAKKVTGTLAHETTRFSALLHDGNLLLAELQLRQQAIHALLLDTQALATELSGLVNDNQSTLNPALQALSAVTTLLQNDQADLAQAIALAGPYYRLLGNALGNGRWFDIYLCGLIPHSVAPGNTPAHGCEPPRP
ncbi:MAG TPA: MCE family protein [Streptosporangiaceae bacterium]|nr:MCE family protein [Streptosporangiaceae bacterium]